MTIPLISRRAGLRLTMLVLLTTVLMIMAKPSKALAAVDVLCGRQCDRDFMYCELSCGVDQSDCMTYCNDEYQACLDACRVPL